MTDKAPEILEDGIELPKYWQVAATHINWLYIIKQMVWRHKGVGIVTSYNAATGELTHIYYLDKAIYSAADLAAAFGTTPDVIEKAGTIELKAKKAWNFPVPPTVDYFGEA